MGNKVHNVVTFGPCTEVQKGAILNLISDGCDCEIVFFERGYPSINTTSKEAEEESMKKMLLALEHTDYRVLDCISCKSGIRARTIFNALFSDSNYGAQKQIQGCMRTHVGEKMVSADDSGTLAEILRHSLIFSRKISPPCDWLQVLSHGFPGVAFRNVYAGECGYPAGIQSALNGESRFADLTNEAAGEQLVSLMHHTNEHGMYPDRDENGKEVLIDRDEMLQRTEERYRSNNRLVRPRDFSFIMLQSPKDTFLYGVDPKAEIQGSSRPDSELHLTWKSPQRSMIQSRTPLAPTMRHFSSSAMRSCASWRPRGATGRFSLAASCFNLARQTI